MHRRGVRRAASLLMVVAAVLGLAAASTFGAGTGNPRLNQSLWLFQQTLRDERHADDPSFDLSQVPPRYGTEFAPGREPGSTGAFLDGNSYYADSRPNDDPTPFGAYAGDFTASVVFKYTGPVPPPRLKVLRWSRIAWTVVFGLCAFLFLHILLRPGSGYVGRTAEGSFITVEALFLVFAVLSLTFWGYFRFRRRPAMAAASRSAPGLTALIGELRAPTCDPIANPSGRTPSCGLGRILRPDYKWQTPFSVSRRLGGGPMRKMVWRQGRTGTTGRCRAASRVVVALVLLFGTMAGGPAARAADDPADLVVNGSFEQPAIRDRSFVQVASIDGWTEDESGAPIEVQRGVAGTPGDGAQFVELDSNRSGGIQQTIQTTPGRRYFLSFLASPRPNTAAPQNRLEVRWDGKPVDTPVELGEGGRDTDWTSIYRILDATKSQTTLGFHDAGTPSDSLGTYLDNVSVTELPKEATAQTEEVPGFEVVTADSPDDDIRDKEISAACPAGKTAIGGGAQVLGNIGHVFLKGSRRSDDTHWTARAGALGPNPWHLRAQVMCVSTSTARSSEIQVITADSPEDGNGSKEVSAACPPGRWAIAGGADVVGKVSGVFLQRSERDRDTRWAAQAESFASDNPWRLQAQVVCVPKSVAQSSGLAVVAADSAQNDLPDKRISIPCPPGKTAVAGGARVSGSIGETFLQWTLRDNDTWTALAEAIERMRATGDPGWKVRVQAVCLSSLAIQPPVAGDDTFNLVEDLPLPQGPPGVLGNDSDPGGEDLTAVLAAEPAHGTVKLRPDGSFTYTPAADYSGPDAFTYKAQNTSGLTSGVATVSLAVSGINDSPRVVNDVAATPAGTPVTVRVTANDKDVDGDALTARLGRAPSSGTATCSGDSCTYTPAAGFTGADSFTYTADDGHGGTGTGRVAITVAPPGTPVAVEDTAETTENTPVRLAVLDNDVPGDAPTTVTATAPREGTLVVADNVITFTPNPGVLGQVEIPYTITDGDGQTSSSRVRLEVTARPPASVPPGPPQPPQVAGATETSTTETTVAGAGTTTTTAVAAGPTKPPGGGDKRRSLFARSVASPSEVRLDLKTIAAHTALGLLLILLIGFPADLFNKAIEENYDDLRDRIRRIPGARFLRTSSSRVTFFVFLVVSTLLYEVLDPTFGWSQAALINMAGLFAGILVSTFAFEFPIGYYTRHVTREETFLRSYPAAIVLAVVCVVISRLANFHPGYCYGLIGGYAMMRGRQLSRTDDGRTVALGALALLGVSLVAWFAWTPIAGAAKTSTNTNVLLTDSVLSTVFVMGIEGLLFALIPLTFLDGSKLLQWRRPLWLVIYVIVVFTFVHTVLDPRAAYLRPTAVGSLSAVLFLFFAFGALSIAVWAYVRHITREGEPAEAAK